MATLAFRLKVLRFQGLKAVSMKRSNLQTFNQVVAALILTGGTASAQQITLRETVDRAQKESFQSTAVTATRDAARASDNAFGARRLPQLFFSANAPVFQKDIIPVTVEDGSTRFVPVQQTTAEGGLTIAQLLPFTGGTFSVTSSLQRYERTGNLANRTWTSSPVRFQLEQPLFRANALRWDGRVAGAELEAAERQFLEDREGVALEATAAFFDLYIARRQLENATANAATNDTLYNLNKGRLEIGKIGENDLLQSELELLKARSALDNAKLEYQRALSAFRLAVNLPSNAEVDVVIPVEVPAIAADTALAVQQALRNSARISDLELQQIQARRSVAEARLNGGPGATLRASVGFNQTAPEMSMAYQDLLQAQRIQLSLSVPVLNWGARGADVQAARSNQKRVEALGRQAREELTQQAHFAALQLAQARRNLDVNAKADTVAAKRFEVAYNRYVIGRIGIDNLYIAQNEKNQAVTQYLQALRNYWMAYYRLRQATLYDFEAGQPIR